MSTLPNNWIVTERADGELVKRILALIPPDEDRLALLLACIIVVGNAVADHAEDRGDAVEGASRVNLMITDIVTIRWE
jgi:hypothetical protein